MTDLQYYYRRLLLSKAKSRCISGRRTLQRPVILLSILLISLLLSTAVIAQRSPSRFYQADDENIQYIGRIDFTNPKLPRFWQPGVYINLKFSGNVCVIILNDEHLWNKNYNYLEIVLDGKAKRIQTKAARDTINFSESLSDGTHTLTICKNTEANIGYIEFVGIRCLSLLKPNPKPKRKIEFIGNSITCAASSDESQIPCGKGVWQDQHNAYMGYAAVTSRTLNAQYHLSAVSGIGLMHSCCGMDIVMPPVFDKISMRNDTITWNFSQYQPDVVTVCLGQNDGIQDSTAFCDNYISFIKQLRGYYPKAQLILLSSPMTSGELKKFMVSCLTAVKKKVNSEGDKKVATFFFEKSYTGGCDYHPSLAEHTLIAKELTIAIKKLMKW